MRLFIKLGVDVGACYWVWLFYCFVLGYQDIYGLVASGLLLLGGGGGILNRVSMHFGTGFIVT